ncbi:glycosyltransferase [Chloroflexota bacterium]
MPSDCLKIAMLSVHSCPVGTLGAKDTGGMSVYIVELARELGKKGHIVDIYTRFHDPRDKQIYELGQNVRLIHLKAGADELINKLAVYPHLPDFSCAVEAFRSQEGTDYDLVFSHYWLSGWVGQYLRLWWQVPHVTVFHTLGAVKNSIGIGVNDPELRIESERDLAGSCQRIIAPTDREKEAIVSYYGASPGNIGVVPCGVNMELFQPVDKEMSKRELGLSDEKIVLFVGRIEPLKGLDRLLESIAYLKGEHKPRLVIVGGDENSSYEEERLLRMSRDLGIEEQITFSGSVKQERLVSFYSAADVCVIPSYYESFGLVALESLACGTRVVSTDVGDAKSIIRQGETGYVVEDNEPRKLAEKIDLLLLNPDSSPLSIRESVRRYEWANIAEEIAKELRLTINIEQISVS